MDLGVRSDASFTDRDSLCHSLPAAAAAVRPDAVRERVRTSHPSEVAQLILLVTRTFARLRSFRAADITLDDSFASWGPVMRHAARKPGVWIG